MSAAATPCYPDGTRVPGHEPQHVGADLFAAMGALHDVLADLELDIAEEDVMRDTANPARRLVAADLINVWQRRHHSLAQFFDLDVYLDRAAVLS